MDLLRYPRGILDRHAVDTRHLDPEALDRLDYFTAQLKRHGIYIKLCLLNYRPFNAADGLPREIERLRGTAYQDRHVVGFFDAAMLELQKDYARQLLAHHNPYMHAAYAEDPAVALVEINNENGLIHAWLWGKVDELPDVFLADLKGQWNRWLRNRYGARPGGCTRRGVARMRRRGKEQIRQRRLLARHRGMAIDADRRRRGRRPPWPTTCPTACEAEKSICVRIDRPGTVNWHVRFETTGHPRGSGLPAFAHDLGQGRPEMRFAAALRAVLEGRGAHAPMDAGADRQPA